MARCRTCGGSVGNGRRTCRECSLEERFGVPADHFDTVDERIELIRGTWSEDDPQVLAFDAPEAGDPVVADVDGELRFLSERLVLPATTDEDEVRAAADEYGRPRVASLSAFAARFDRAHFEWDRPDRNEPRELFLQGLTHYCHICDRPFTTLTALVEHACPSDGEVGSRSGRDDRLDRGEG